MDEVTLHSVPSESAYLGLCPGHEAGTLAVLGLGLPSLHGEPDSLRHGGCVKYTLCSAVFLPLYSPNHALCAAKWSVYLAIY